MDEYVPMPPLDERTMMLTTEEQHRLLQSSANEVGRLCDFLTKHFPHEPGRGDSLNGESCVDVAIRLLRAIQRDVKPPLRCWWSEEDRCYIATHEDHDGISAFGVSPAQTVAELAVALGAAAEVYRDEIEQITGPARKGAT